MIVVKQRMESWVHICTLTYACVISEEESQFQDEVAEAKDTDNIPKQQGPEENNKTSDDKPKEEL